MTKLKFILLTIICLITNVIFSQKTDTVQQKINYYISHAKLDSAKVYIQSALKDINQKQNESILNYQLTTVLFMQSDYDEALKLAFNSLDKIDNEQEKVKFNFMIACIYSTITDYSKSVDYFDLVVEHSKDSSLLVKSHLLLSDLYTQLKDSTNAGKSLKEAYKITNLTNLDSKTKNHVAKQYNFYNKNYELCKEQNFEIIRDTTSFLNTKSYAYSMIGDCLIKQDSLIEATKYYDEHLKLTFETKDPEQIKDAANKLIEVYEKLGNQERANTYHKIYNEAVNDSSSFSAEKYRDLYDIEKNRELEIIKNNNLIKYLIFGLTLLLLISFSIYYYLKLKKENKEIFNSLKKTPSKKIIISDNEIEKINTAIIQLKDKQLFLTPNITRKSFCLDNNIKSERYLSQYINEEYRKSFSVFINDLRIEYAYNRIKKDSKFRNFKIEEVAKESGFGSKKSFERVFVSKYKETPFKFISKLTA